MIKIGDNNELVVNRKTDIGYMLESLQGDEVFLHNNEKENKDLIEGEKVRCYIYLDHKGRTAATLKEAFITVREPGFLSVKDINWDIGVFLDNGISKDLLFSKEDLPKDTALWPTVGDKIFVKLIVKGKLVAKLVSKDDIPKEKKTLEKGSLVNAFVQVIGHEGINLLSLDNNKIFVYKTNIRNKYRIGESVEVKIININENGYNGSLLANKEVLLVSDALFIFNYLKNGPKEMALNNDSSPEEINKIFKISKKAFKRALGHLYKERLIAFKDDKTVLVEGVNHGIK